VAETQRTGRRHLGRLLLACATDAPSTEVLARAVGQVLPREADPLVRLAREHGLGPLVHQRLERFAHPLARQVVALLEEDRAVARARHLLTLRSLIEVVAALHRPFLVLKGPALAVGWYDDPGLRPYNDLDLLVRARDFSMALEALGAVGFAEVSRNWRGFLELGVAEVPLAKDATCVDLHWDPVALGSQRREVRVDVEDLFARASWRSIGPARVLTPDPTSTLLHLCVNSGLDGARRLLKVVDIDRVCRDPHLDWAAFVLAASAAGAHPLAHGVLRRAVVLLGSPVPTEVLAELSPFPGWSVLTRPRLRPDTRLHRGVSGGLLLSSGRATIVRTAAAMRDGAWQALRERTVGAGPTLPGGALDWQREDPAGVSARGDYLAWVESSSG
jgi:hypothetical protein